MTIILLTLLSLVGCAADPTETDSASSVTPASEKANVGGEEGTSEAAECPCNDRWGCDVYGNCIDMPHPNDPKEPKCSWCDTGE